MHRLLRSKYLGSLAAVAVGLYGFYVGCRQMMGATIQAITSPVRFDVAHYRQTAYFDFVLYLFGFGLVGILVGLFLTSIQEALNALDRVHDWRSGEPERWEQLLSQFVDRAAFTRGGEPDLPPVRAHQEAIDAIRRAIQGQEWKEAAQLLDLFKLNEPSHPEIDRLSEVVESGRRETVDSHLELIQVSREVNDSERVLELYQNVAPLLDAPARKSLEEDLAKWFMSAIQRRLRSGTIQAEVVTLSARVSEIFSGTTEGASLRAGLPTLRRTVGLCPRCAGPYIGVAEACPTCLGATSS